MVINLSGLDCTTYLETVATLVRPAEEGELPSNAFEKELAYLRYRNRMNQVLLHHV